MKLKMTPIPALVKNLVSKTRIVVQKLDAPVCSGVSNNNY